MGGRGLGGRRNEELLTAVRWMHAKREEGRWMHAQSGRRREEWESRREEWERRRG